MFKSFLDSLSHASSAEVLCSGSRHRGGKRERARILKKKHSNISSGIVAAAGGGRSSRLMLQ